MSKSCKINKISGVFIIIIIFTCINNYVLAIQKTDADMATLKLKLLFESNGTANANEISVALNKSTKIKGEIKDISIIKAEVISFDPLQDKVSFRITDTFNLNSKIKGVRNPGGEICVDLALSSIECRPETIRVFTYVNLYVGHFLSNLSSAKPYWEIGENRYSINIYAINGLLEDPSGSGICDFIPLAIFPYPTNATVRNLKNKIDEIKELIKRGADVNLETNKGHTPLIIASLNYYPEIVKLLIEAGADVNIGSNRGLYPLRQAVIRDDIEIVRLLLNAGAKVNNTTSGFDFAVIDGNIGIVELLLEAGADANGSNEAKASALHSAVTLHQIDMARLLLEAKANPNTKDKNEETPLGLAIKYDLTDIIKLLLEAKADVNTKIRDKNGLYTPLEFAKKKGDEMLIKRLKAYGAEE